MAAALVGPGPRAVFARCCRAAGLAAYSSVPAGSTGEGQQREASVRRRGRTSQFVRSHAPPRTERMAVNQDWSSVYPTAAAFKAASVPLPIRMGYPVKRGVPPPKEGNLRAYKDSQFFASYSSCN